MCFAVLKCASASAAAAATYERFYSKLMRLNSFPRAESLVSISPTSPHLSGPHATQACITSLIKSRKYIGGNAIFTFRSTRKAIVSPLLRES